jgi:hypothetical protein
LDLDCIRGRGGNQLHDLESALHVDNNRNGAGEESSSKEDERVVKGVSKRRMGIVTERERRKTV